MLHIHVWSLKKKLQNILKEDTLFGSLSSYSFNADAEPDVKVNTNGHEQRHFTYASRDTLKSFSLSVFLETDQFFEGHQTNVPRIIVHKHAIVLLII